MLTRGGRALIKKVINGFQPATIVKITVAL